MKSGQQHNYALGHMSLPLRERGLEFISFTCIDHASKIIPYGIFRIILFFFCQAWALFRVLYLKARERIQFANVIKYCFANWRVRHLSAGGGSGNHRKVPSAMLTGYYPAFYFVKPHAASRFGAFLRKKSPHLNIHNLVERNNQYLNFSYIL
ncbi:MAG: hypothetical protein ACK5JF_03700 [Oscillospiraceae bacterium]